MTSMKNKSALALPLAILIGSAASAAIDIGSPPPNGVVLCGEHSAAASLGAATYSACGGAPQDALASIGSAIIAATSGPSCAPCVYPASGICKGTVQVLGDDGGGAWTEYDVLLGEWCAYLKVGAGAQYVLSCRSCTSGSSGV